MPIPEDHGGSANSNSHYFQIKSFRMEVQAKYTYSSSSHKPKNEVGQLKML